MSRAKFVQHDGAVVPVGGELLVDNNLYATLTKIIPPADDLDDGQLEIRWSWGATDRIVPTRAGGYIATD